MMAEKPSGLASPDCRHLPLVRSFSAIRGANMADIAKAESRRRFFQFLAASVVLTPAARALAQQLAAPPSSQPLPPLSSAKDALQIMDFEEAARLKLPPA